MKAQFFGVTLLLFFLGCTSQENDQLSSRQKDQIISEVKTVADSIWAKWEEIDPQGALPYYLDSSESIFINSVGSRYDYQTYKKLASDFKNSAIAYKWTTISRDFIFVTKELAICTWIGKDEAFWKSGDKTTFDPHTYTLVFKKIASQWKLVYSHDSGIAVTQKVGEK